VLTLGAVILKTSENHEAAIRLGEAALILGWRLLIAVLALALAMLTQHALEEFAVLELVLDGVAVIGARLFQELLEAVSAALSPARAVSRRDGVGVGTTPVLLLPFPLP
jgi:hypothetical protein